MLWGWSFATLELIVKSALWIAVAAGVVAALSAFIAGLIAVAAGVVAALSGFIAGYVGLRLTDAIQKEADLRIADADRRAGEAQLALEQFKGHCHATSGLRSRWRFCSQGDEENQLSRLPLSARDHPAGDLALSPVHTKPT